jgi:putative ABC transport system substrate-binding protein
MPYEPNLSEIFRRCGEYVGKVLRGAKPSELPIRRPERFDLVINLKTAKVLGLVMPAQIQQLRGDRRKPREFIALLGLAALCSRRTA